MDHSHNNATSIKHVTVNRRKFLKSAGQLSGALSVWAVSNKALSATSILGFSGATTSTSNTEISAIEASIKANFGSGFQLVSCQFDADETHALIEHLENRYWVASSNRHDWRIVQTTDI